MAYRFGPTGFAPPPPGFAPQGPPPPGFRPVAHAPTMTSMSSGYGPGTPMMSQGPTMVQPGPYPMVHAPTMTSMASAPGGDPRRLGQPAPITPSVLSGLSNVPMAPTHTSIPMAPTHTSIPMAPTMTSTRSDKVKRGGELGSKLPGPHKLARIPDDDYNGYNGFNGPTYTNNSVAPSMISDRSDFIKFQPTSPDNQLVPSAKPDVPREQRKPCHPEDYPDMGWEDAKWMNILLKKGYKHLKEPLSKQMKDTIHASLGNTEDGSPTGYVVEVVKFKLKGDAPVIKGIKGYNEDHDSVTVEVAMEWDAQINFELKCTGNFFGVHAPDSGLFVRMKKSGIMFAARMKLWPLTHIPPFCEAFGLQITEAPVMDLEWTMHTSTGEPFRASGHEVKMSGLNGPALVMYNKHDICLNIIIGFHYIVSPMDDDPKTKLPKPDEYGPAIEANMTVRVKGDAQNSTMLLSPHNPAAVADRAVPEDPDPVESLPLPWLNEMVAALWPSIRTYANKMGEASIITSIETSPQRKEFKRLELVSFDLGKTPALFHGTYINAIKDGFASSLGVDFDSDFELKIFIEGTGSGITFPPCILKVHNLKFGGLVDEKVFPLVDRMPLAAAGGITMAGAPHLSFDTSLSHARSGAKIECEDLAGMGPFLHQVLEQDIVLEILLKVPWYITKMIPDDDPIGMPPNWLDAYKGPSPFTAAHFDEEEIRARIRSLNQDANLAQLGHHTGGRTPTTHPGQRTLMRPGTMKQETLGPATVNKAPLTLSGTHNDKNRDKPILLGLYIKGAFPGSLHFLAGAKPNYLMREMPPKGQWIPSGLLGPIFKATWPHMSIALGTSLLEAVGPMMESYRPAYILHTLKVTALDLGTIPIKVKAFRIPQGTPDGEFLMDFDIEWDGDPNIVLLIDGLLIPEIEIRLTKFHLAGQLRIKLCPFINEPPFVAAAGCHFLLPPDIHFDLEAKTAGIDLLKYPSVSKLLKDTMDSIVGSTSVCPVWISSPIAAPEQLPAGWEREYETEAQGVILVQVVQASKLKSTEFIGKGDPYCKVDVGTQLGSDSKQTHTLTNNANPVWNKGFALPVGNTKWQKLIFCIMDEDIGTDDIIGNYSQNIDGLIPHEVEDHWHPLDEEGAGDLHFRLVWVPLEDTLMTTAHEMCPRLLDAWKGRLGGEGAGEMSAEGVLIVQVIAAKDLENHDTWGNSDPYVVLDVGTGINHDRAQKTQTINNNLNPHWNEGFAFPVMNRDRQNLHVHMFDDDTAKSDTLMGTLEINTKNLKPTQVQDEWYPLQKANKGELRLKLLFVPLEGDTATLAKAQEIAPNLVKRWQPHLSVRDDDDDDDPEERDPDADLPVDGVLLVQMIEAQDLVNSDWLSLSDAYVAFSVGNEELGTYAYVTETIVDNLNPWWNEGFAVAVPTKAENKLFLSVFDEDAWPQEDDPLGMIERPLDTMEPGKLYDEWHDLQHVDQGKVHLRMIYVPTPDTTKEEAQLKGAVLYEERSHLLDPDDEQVEVEENDKMGRLKTQTKSRRLVKAEQKMQQEKANQELEQSREKGSVEKIVDQASNAVSNMSYVGQETLNAGAKQISNLASLATGSLSYALGYGEKPKGPSSKSKELQKAVAKKEAKGWFGLGSG